MESVRFAMHTGYVCAGSLSIPVFMILSIRHDPRDQETACLRDGGWECGVEAEYKIGSALAYHKL